jgi:hypothetical protein
MRHDPTVAMTRMSLRARALALLPLSALGVHQLRYELAFGGDAGHELAAEGHAYLTSLTPLLVLAAALGAAELLTRLARAWYGRDGSGRRTSLPALALAVAVSLVVIYVGQELLEGLLATGHPGGLIGVFGDGGWWSVPLAIGFGAGIALLLRGADMAIALIAHARSPARTRPVTPGREGAPRVVILPVRSPFASAAPGRAPPLGIAST